MIQVCSQCGTRWNVRDSERVWCPRCRGRLLASSMTPAVPGGGPPPGQPAGARPTGRLPAGFRWIAVRPGPPPPPARRRRPLGPTPRYQVIPRWGLVDQLAPAQPAAVHARRGVSVTAVRATLLAAGAIFAVAAAVHLLRYVLLLINRSTLLPPLLATATLLLGILASLAAIAAVIATVAVTTSWLIGRRTLTYQRLGQDDPRPEWQLWTGCVIPVVNLVLAPVFAMELAHAERSGPRLRGPITAWWIAWVFSTAVSAWAIWTSTATEPQAIADNTVTVIIAYLAGLAVVVLLWRVMDGFVRTPVERPLHRWVVVDDRDATAGSDDRENSEPDPDGTRSEKQVESDDREPAA